MDFVPHYAFPLDGWYKEERLAKAVDLCMKAIADAGISGDEAVIIPKCLEMAIERSNSYALDGAVFQPKLINWEEQEKDESGFSKHDDCFETLLWLRSQRPSQPFR